MVKEEGEASLQHCEREQVNLEARDAPCAGDSPRLHVFRVPLLDAKFPVTRQFAILRVRWAYGAITFRIRYPSIGTRITLGSYSCRHSTSLATTESSRYSRCFILRFHDIMPEVPTSKPSVGDTGSSPACPASPPPERRNDTAPDSKSRIVKRAIEKTADKLGRSKSLGSKTQLSQSQPALPAQAHKRLFSLSNRSRGKEKSNGTDEGMAGGDNDTLGLTTVTRTDALPRGCTGLSGFFCCQSAKLCIACSNDAAQIISMPLFCKGR